MIRMIKVKIKHTKLEPPPEIKEFKNEKEMLEYGLNIHSEIIISQLHPSDFDYEMEIYDYYRE